MSKLPFAYMIADIVVRLIARRHYSDREKSHMSRAQRTRGHNIARIVSDQSVWPNGTSLERAMAERSIYDYWRAGTGSLNRINVSSHNIPIRVSNVCACANPKHHVCWSVEVR